MAQVADVSLPRDDDSSAVQVLSPAANGTVHLTAVEANSTSSAVPAGADVVRIAASGPIYLAFGGSGVDAGVSQSDSMFFPAGAEAFFLRDNSYTHVAARSVAGAGNVVVTVTKLV